MTDEKTEVQVVEETSIKQSFSQLGSIQKEFTPEQVKFIMETVAPGLNEKEIWLFLLKASLLKLNPLMGEIFAYVAIDKETNQRRLVTIAGRNGKRNKALQNPRLEYIETDAIYIKVVQVPEDKEKGQAAQAIKVTTEPWDGSLWGARCTIKLKDREKLTIVTVPLAEYQSQKAIWKYKPETMIKKVAESQAIDAAGLLGASDLYDDAERFDIRDDAGDARPAPTVDNPGVAADESMLKTIEVLGGETERTYTRQEAADEIQRLNNKRKNDKKR